MYDQRVVSYIAQIANALQHLQQRFRFNHCDLMTSNTMYHGTRDNTFRTLSGAEMPLCGVRHKLIDFGFSSVEINGRPLVSPAFVQIMDCEYTYKPERDMMQLLFYMLREHWRKLSTDILHYICNLLTVLTGDAVNMFGIFAVPEFVCFWKTRQNVRYHAPHSKPLVVREWRDIYGVVGHAAFRNSKTVPASILADISKCMTASGPRHRLQYDTQALTTLHTAVRMTTVKEYFGR